MGQLITFEAINIRKIPKLFICVWETTLNLYILHTVSDLWKLMNIWTRILEDTWNLSSTYAWTSLGNFQCVQRNGCFCEIFAVFQDWRELWRMCTFNSKSCLQTTKCTYSSLNILHCIIGLTWPFRSIILTACVSFSAVLRFESEHFPMVG